MNLKEISDEELVDDVNDYDQYNDDKIQELKDRLARIADRMRNEI